MAQIEQTPPRDRLAITADCPTCGRMDVPIRNVNLWVESAGVSSYSFVCSGCCGLVRTPADAGTVGVLLVAAPPIGHRDLSSFRAELERGDWFHRFEQSYGSTVRPDCGGTRNGFGRTWSKVAGVLTRLAERHRLLFS